MTAPAVPGPTMERTATISDCGRYRYRLERRWADAPPLTFVMLNPSTADADVDDPTIRRCMGFARREGAGGIVVVNLWALRATNPKELRTAADPYGANWAFLREAIEAPGRKVAAWGAWAGPNNSSLSYLVADVYRAQRQLMCLGKTKAGAPRHPLYVRADVPLEVWR